jgi:hypothetical protein
MSLIWNDIFMNFKLMAEHNQRMLKTYTRDKGYVNLRVAQLDSNGKILNVFKNRYSASRYVIETKMSNYLSPKGLGFTRAAIAGTLTNCMMNTAYAYGYYWKILSPYDSSLVVTKKYKNDSTYKNNKISDTKRWIVIDKTKEIEFNSLKSISKTYNIGIRTVTRMAKTNETINALSLIKKNIFPTEKTFDSFSHMQRFFRISRETAKKIIDNKLIIRTYIPIIPSDKLIKNYEKTNCLRKLA